jgi:hypothetical protein
MNHDYNTPDEGTLDWHVPLNDNFRRIDRDVEVRDEESARDAYEPTDGAKFLATDTGTLFLGDGTEWRRFGSVTGGSAGSSPGSALRVSTAEDLAAALESLDGSGPRVEVIVERDVVVDEVLPWNDLPDGSTVRGGGNGRAVEFAHGTSDPAISIGGKTGVDFDDLALVTQNSDGPLLEFTGEPYVSNQVGFHNVEFFPEGGGPAVFSEAQPWGLEFNLCHFRNLKYGGGDVYLRMGGVNNTFTNCQFSQIPDGEFAVRPSPSGGAESWVFNNCTFGGYFDSDGGALKGVDYDTTTRITPVTFLGTSFEGLTQNGTGTVVETAGLTRFESCWFRENLGDAQITLGYQGNSAETRVVNCRFDELIPGVDVDASNHWRSTCYVTPLSSLYHGVDDPDGVVYGDDLVASGSTTLSSGEAVVDTGIASETATFEVSVGAGPGAGGVTARLGYDDTHRVYLEDVDGGDASVNYRVVRRSP